MQFRGRRYVLSIVYTHSFNFFFPYMLDGIDTSIVTQIMFLI